MKTLRRCQTLCGTFFEMEIGSLKQSEEALIEFSTKAFAHGAMLEKMFSPFNETSELSRFNQCIPYQVFHCSDIFYKALEKTKFLFEETDGLFTPYQNRQSLNYRFVLSNEVARFNEIPININGFIKGWIIDEMVETLINSGVDQILVNAGGDLRYWFRPGLAAQLTHPQVGIRDLEDPNAVHPLPLIEPCALATSAEYPYDYEHSRDHKINFVDKDVEPPRKNSYFTATVVAPTAWIADALTKVLVQNPKQAEICAQRWKAQLFYKSREKELCFAPSKT